MKILQLYYKLPFPQNDGGAYSIYHSTLSLLSQGAEVRILAMEQQKSAGDVLLIPDDFKAKTNFESAPVDNRIKPFNALKNLFGHTSYFVERFYSEDFRNMLIRILKTEQFEIIHLEHLYLCLYLRDIRKYSNAKVVLRTQNVEFLLWEIFLKKVKNPFIHKFLSIATSRLRIFENQMIETVDGVMTLSDNDRDSFKQLTIPKKIISVPLGIDFSRFREINSEKQYENPTVHYHLGSMDWQPNIQGMKWFVNKVMPEVVENHPGVKICIAGKNMPSWFFNKQNKNLQVEGIVADAVKYQEDKPILIVPLLTGSGIRVKILEAMAMGKTIISTSIGAQGIPLENDVNILLADTPDEFVAQITRCLNSEDLTRKIGTNARLFAIERFDLVKIGSEMVEFYELLLKEK